MLPVLESGLRLLIYAGSVLALLGVLLVLYAVIRERLEERVESGEKPERTGLPYPDLYYWHVLKQRSSLGARMRRAFRKGKSQGV
jgi:hypothetical protein